MYNAEKKILHRYMSRKKFPTPERFGKKFFQNKLNQTKSVKSPIPHALPHKRPMVMSTI